MDEWIRRCDTNIYNGVLVIKKKKNETLPFAITWMDLEGIKLNKSEIDKYYMILLLRGIWKNKTNVTKQKQS